MCATSLPRLPVNNHHGFLPRFFIGLSQFAGCEAASTAGSPSGRAESSKSSELSFFPDPMNLRARPMPLPSLSLSILPASEAESTGWFGCPSPRIEMTVKLMDNSPEYSNLGADNRHRPFSPGGFSSIPRLSNLRSFYLFGCTKGKYPGRLPGS